MIKGDPFKMLAEALSKDIITQDEAELCAAAEQAGLAAITVDDFSAEELMGSGAALDKKLLIPTI